MSDDRYEIVVARPAATAIAEQLPEAVAAAVIQLITGALLDNPRRVGVRRKQMPLKLRKRQHPTRLDALWACGS